MCKFLHCCIVSRTTIFNICILVFHHFVWKSGRLCITTNPSKQTTVVIKLFHYPTLLNLPNLQLIKQSHAFSNRKHRGFLYTALNNNKSYFLQFQTTVIQSSSPTIIYRFLASWPWLRPDMKPCLSCWRRMLTESGPWGINTVLPWPRALMSFNISKY